MTKLSNNPNNSNHHNLKNSPGHNNNSLDTNQGLF